MKRVSIVALITMLLFSQLSYSKPITKTFVKPVSEVFVLIEDCQLLKENYSSKISTAILKAPDTWSDSLEYAMNKINLIMPYQNVYNYNATIFPLNNRCEARCTFAVNNKEAYVMVVYSKDLNVVIVTALSDKAFKKTKKEKNNK